jgi:hypothetical protein
VAYRAFSAASWWNKPMPADAPIDPNDAIYIAEAMDRTVSSGYLRITGAPDHGLTGETWSYPIYWADAMDPIYTIVPSAWGPGISIRIPYGATPQLGSDGALIVFDLSGNTAQELYQATYDAARDMWSATSTKRYILDSNGLDKRATGSDDALNDGHRGVATPIRAVRLEEVRSGAIRRRLECFWHATGRPDHTTPSYYWPMVGSESGKGGIVPEGIVLRIKSHVDLATLGLSPGAMVIARALQEYGCVIGDNDGGTNNSIKLQRGPAQWADIDPALSVDSLSVLGWSEWEFVEGAYDPPEVLRGEARRLIPRGACAAP